jgi:hypothetical protein
MIVDFEVNIYAIKAAQAIVIAWLERPTIPEISQ